MTTKAIVSITTGETAGHTHVARIDDQTGDGTTSRDDGHTHRVSNFAVQPGGTDNHRHSLRRPTQAAKAEDLLFDLVDLVER